MSKTAARFTLDEDAARAWLADGVEADGDFLAHQDADNTLPEIDAEWMPLLDNTDEITVLIGAALGHGIITHPPGVGVGLDDDSGGDGYRWLVYLYHGIEQRLILASPFVSQSQVGNATARGAEAGLAVLREAVASANECLDDLDAYTAARAAEPDDVACGQADETGEDG
jgi:hypothetical protein